MFLVAIKLLEHKQEHGKYPATLEPIGGAAISRIDGKPVEYLRRDGKVILRGGAYRNEVEPDADPATDKRAAKAEAGRAWIWDE